MSTTLRTVLGVLGAIALAALATPELSSHLPAGVAQTLAAVLALGLHQLNPKAAESAPAEK